MEIKIVATDKITELDGIPVRLWTGFTKRGTECKVFVHRIAVHNNADASEFETELKEEIPPGITVSLSEIL